MGESGAHPPGRSLGSAVGPHHLGRLGEIPPQLRFLFCHGCRPGPRVSPPSRQGSSGEVVGTSTTLVGASPATASPRPPSQHSQRPAGGGQPPPSEGPGEALATTLQSPPFLLGATIVGASSSARSGPLSEPSGLLEGLPRRAPTFRIDADLFSVGRPRNGLVPLHGPLGPGQDVSATKLAARGQAYGD